MKNLSEHKVPYKVAKDISSILLQESWDIETALVADVEDNIDNLSKVAWDWYREKLSICLAAIGWTLEELDAEETKEREDFYADLELESRDSDCYELEEDYFNSSIIHDDGDED